MIYKIHVVTEKSKPWYKRRYSLITLGTKHDCVFTLERNHTLSVLVNKPAYTRMTDESFNYARSIVRIVKLHLLIIFIALCSIISILWNDKTKWELLLINLIVINFNIHWMLYVLNFKITYIESYLSKKGEE